jgi:Flp pilus assembly protein TadG
MRFTPRKLRQRRRGIIAVLSALMFVVVLAMVAFAVDIGYMGVIRAQLQGAADSAALAAAGASSLSQSQMVQVAQAFAQYHLVGGRQVVLNSSDVQFGTWDVTSRTFTALQAGQLGTAVKVTVRADASSGGLPPLFFARTVGGNERAQQASAVAMVNPRDICFVVDLSNSMSDDTKPSSSVTSHDNLIQAVYDDLFGVAGSGASNVTYNPSESQGSTATTSITNAMKWVKTNYPYIVPLPDTSGTASVAYWTAALNYSDSYLGTPFASKNYQGTVTGYKMRYKDYVKFLMYLDRNETMGAGNGYTIMSVMNPSYKSHSETVGSTSYSGFPSPEMPTHALRRAVIAALQTIQDRNASISDANQKDWVSIVTFDRKGSGNTLVRQQLTSNYTAVMQSAVTLQSCYYADECTDSEGGLIVARNHIKAQSQGGAGRENANKIIVFLTDGKANLFESSTGVIDQYMQQNPGGWDNDYPSNGALMQTSQMQGNNWYLYAVGIGVSADQTFMNRMAVKGGTAVNGATYANTTNSSTYETTLRNIFQGIITNPKLRLVQ